MGHVWVTLGNMTFPPVCFWVASFLKTALTAQNAVLRDRRAETTLPIVKLPCKRLMAGGHAQFHAKPLLNLSEFWPSAQPPHPVGLMRLSCVSGVRPASRVRPLWSARRQAMSTNRPKAERATGVPGLGSPKDAVGPVKNLLHFAKGY